MLLNSVLVDPVYEPIKEPYERWYEFMREKVDFWLPDSEWHTKTHSARVLLLALLIGHQKGLSDKEIKKLGYAAVFHDSRRLDDGIDQGHGARAAAYYRDYCYKHNLPFDEQTHHVIYYHDQDDALGISNIQKLSDCDRGVLLYEIFKDADGLDRFRLGPDALDEKFLRTEEARGLVEFAKELLEKSSGLET